MKYFEIMKRLKLSRTKKVKAWKIKGKGGTHIIDKLLIIERWAEFYEDLYSDNRVEFTAFITDERIPHVLIEK